MLVEVRIKLGRVEGLLLVLGVRLVLLGERRGEVADGALIDGRRRRGRRIAD